MNEARELLRIAREVVADEIPSWVSADFVLLINTGGTILKKFKGSLHGASTWILKGNAKIYKDPYGHISVGWTVNPMRIGQNWEVQSELSFAPASSGSFANEKFDEFKKTVQISGKSEFGLFGIERKVLAVVPGDSGAAKEVEDLISQHAKDLSGAKRFWKQQAALFKEKYGGFA